MDDIIQNSNISELTKLASEAQSAVVDAMKLVATQKAKILELEETIKKASAENLNLKSQINEINNLRKQASLDVDETLLTEIVNKLAKANVVDVDDVDSNIAALRANPKLAFTVLNQVADMLPTEDVLTNGSFIASTKTASIDTTKHSNIPAAVLEEIAEFERQNFS